MKNIGLCLILVLLIYPSINYSQQIEDFIGLWEYISDYSIMDLKVKNDGDFWFDLGGSFQIGSWRLDDSHNLILYFYDYPPESFMLKDNSELYWTGRGISFDYLGNNPNELARKREEIRKNKEELRKQELKEKEKKEIQEKDEKENARTSLINAYIGDAYENYYQNNYKQAVYNFEQAMEIDNDYTLEKSRYELVNSYVKVAEDFYNKLEFEEAKKSYALANKYSINGNEYNENLQICSKQLLQQFLQVGNSKYKLKDYSGSLENYLAANELLQENVYIDNHFELNKKISLCYEKIGDFYDKKEQYDKAMDNYQKSYKYNPIKRVKEKMSNYYE